MSKQITEKEAREMLLEAVRALAEHWAGVTDPYYADMRMRLDGFTHSLLCMFDGVSGTMPCAIDLVLRPHPDDKQYNIDRGEDWIEDGMCINDCHLHEMFKRLGPSES